MGLFHFLKRKTNPVTDFIQSPAVQQRTIGVRLEFLQKQVANLVLVGRGDDAKKEIDKFLDEYFSSSSGPCASPSDLGRIAFRLAYRIYPELVHYHWTDFLELWNGALPFPHYLALKGAVEDGHRLSLSEMKAFKCYHSKLTDDIDYYLIQFPDPPVRGQEMSLDDLIAQSKHDKQPSANEIPVSGPYYVVALAPHNNSARTVFVLDQSPGARSMLRQVIGGGSSLNCCRSPEPTIDNFLQELRNMRLKSND